MRANVEKKKQYALNIKNNYLPQSDPKKVQQMQNLLAKQYYGRRLHQERMERSRLNSEKIKSYFQDGIVKNRPIRPKIVNKSADHKITINGGGLNGDNRDDVKTSAPSDNIKSSKQELIDPNTGKPGLFGKYGLKLNLGKIINYGRKTPGRLQ